MLKIGKGQYNLGLVACFAGAQSRVQKKVQAGGGDYLQQLASEYGKATGKEKYFVARSERCSIVGLITFFENEHGLTSSSPTSPSLYL